MRETLYCWEIGHRFSGKSGFIKTVGCNKGIKRESSKRNGLIEDLEREPDKK